MVLKCKNIKPIKRWYIMKQKMPQLFFSKIKRKRPLFDNNCLIFVGN